MSLQEVEADPKRVFKNCFPSRKERFSSRFEKSGRAKYRDGDIGEATLFEDAEKILL